jgi:hypothetical protein
MADPPSDGLGDGTQTEAFSIMVDVTTLSRYQAAEYRRELIHAIYHPGTEFDMVGPQWKIDSDAYKRQVAKLDIYLATFTE